MILVTGSAGRVGQAVVRELMQNQTPGPKLGGCCLGVPMQPGQLAQIGIGSLGDAVAHGLILRHRKNGDFRGLIDRSIDMDHVLLK